MKVTITAFLFAIGDMNVDSSHAAKIITKKCMSIIFKWNVFAFIKLELNSFETQIEN
jgi:hypothetical protein